VPEWADVEKYPHIVEDTARHTESQFEAWEMMVGRLEPELGGAVEMLDFVGVNYYWNNQWVHGGDRKPPGHADHKPLHRMLVELWQRFRRPILITETGAEGGADVGWLGYMASELRQAQREGVEIVGMCLYPVMDYPGWDDDRHCRCGLIAIDEDWSERWLRDDLAAELRLQAAAMEASLRAEEEKLEVSGMALARVPASIDAQG
jgi:beta-glucosidase/6-phospho-beta-glucosidase/beta-galactosidase